ncbi:MAG: hypothetical protein K6G10_01405 [Butyrivibrio sp.]|nr:hypothetical protein [Butyrivibrio sp.]
MDYVQRIQKLSEKVEAEKERERAAKEARIKEKVDKILPDMKQVLLVHEAMTDAGFEIIEPVGPIGVQDSTFACGTYSDGEFTCMNNFFALTKNANGAEELMQRSEVELSEDAFNIFIDNFPIFKEAYFRSIDKFLQEHGA